MKCPACGSSRVESRGKRHALYPSGLLSILGLPVAQLHQASTPIDYHCHGCKLDFTRRTTPARFAGVLLILLICAFLLLFAVLVLGLFLVEMAS